MAAVIMIQSLKTNFSGVQGLSIGTCAKFDGPRININMCPSLI